MSEIKLPPLPAGWEAELLDWVSACQSAYHIDNTPGHRFGGLGSNLEENRSEIVCFVRGLIESHATAAIEADRMAQTPPNELFAIVADRIDGEGPSLAYWNGQNYQFSDGDCFNREGDTLGGYTAEFLTDYQLEKRLFADRQARGEPVVKESLTTEIPRDLLGQIVDEVFDGAVEDTSVIEDIYRVIARTVKQSLTVEPRRIPFPFFLRKMWSGSEVQEWLDKYTGHVQQEPTAKGGLERYQEYKAKQSEPVNAPSDEEILQAMSDAMGKLVPVSDFIGQWEMWPGTRSFAVVALKAYRDLMLHDAKAAQSTVPDSVFLGCARMGIAGATDAEVLNYVRIAISSAAPQPEINQ